MGAKPGPVALLEECAEVRAAEVAVSQSAVRARTCHSGRGPALHPSQPACSIGMSPHSHLFPFSYCICRDVANGFLVAEVFSRYFPVSLHGLRHRTLTDLACMFLGRVCVLAWCSCLGQFWSVPASVAAGTPAVLLTLRLCMPRPCSKTSRCTDSPMPHHHTTRRTTGRRYSGFVRSR